MGNLPVRQVPGDHTGPPSQQQAPGRRRWLVLAALLLAWWPLAGAAGDLSLEPSAFRPGERERFLDASNAVRSGKWEYARALAREGLPPAAAKLIDWYYFANGAAGADFEEIARFIR